MEKSIVNRAAATIAATMMACTLGAMALAPQSAFAAEQPLTPLTTQAASANGSLATQATKKVVYLRTKAGAAKYSYNSNGLIAKIKGTYETWTFKYSGVRMTSAVKKTNYDTVKLTLKYDSKGRVKSIKSKGSESYNTYTKTFKYNSKNRVTKAIQKDTTGNASTSKYTYDSKGRVVKTVSGNLLSTIAYDSKGNPKSASSGPRTGTGFTRYVTYKNSYSNGRLTKVVLNTQGIGQPLTTKISYASKKLTKKYAAAAKAQQRALLVATPNSVLPLSLS